MAVLGPGGEGPDEKESSVRASDHERGAVVEALSEHASAGRLTLAEHEERVGRALVAASRSELDALVSDLPAPSPSAPVARRRKATRWLVSVLGGANRTGRWRLSDRVVSIAVMGGQDIDLRHAEIDDQETTITVVAVMGGCDIYVPESVEVVLSSVALLGGNDEIGSPVPPRPGAPRLHVKAFALMGGIDIVRLPEDLSELSGPKARRALRRRS